MQVLGRAKSRLGSSRTALRAGGVLLAVLAAVYAAAPVLAADDFEPNDSQAKATKLQNGKTYNGDIDKLDDAVSQTKGDVDWYSLNAAAGQVEIAYTALQTQGSCFGPEARLLDGSGQTLGTAQPARGDTEQIKYTASSDGVLYLRVQQYQIDSCDAPIPYRIKPEFTEAKGGGGGSGGGSGIDGLRVKAKKSQKQRGKRIQVKLEVGAAETVDVAVKGSVKAGKRKLKLSKDVGTADPGELTKLVLGARGKAGKQIRAALDAGDKVVAKLKIAVADTDGNDAALGTKIRLR